MPRAPFPSGRKSLLLPALAAMVISGAWWWQRPPPEPLVHGQRFSEWLPSQNLTSTDELHSVSPVAIKWLTYKVEHGEHPFTRRGPLPFDRAPAWLRERIPLRWGGLRERSRIDERWNAIAGLGLLGPEAAPAIPVLAKYVENDDPYLVSRVINTLYAIGPEAWPILKQAVVHERAAVWLPALEEMDVEPATFPILQHAAEHGCQPARVAAMEKVNSWDGTRWVQGGMEPRPPAEVKRVAEILAIGCRDPDPQVQIAAAGAIGNRAATLRGTIFLDSLMPVLTRLLSKPDRAVPLAAMDALRRFEATAAPAAPAVARMLDGGDEVLTRAAAMTLHAMGPAAWPVVTKILEQASPRARIALLQTMTVRFERQGKDPADDDGGEYLEAMIQRCHDSDAEVRRAAAGAIGECHLLRKEGTAFDSAIPELIRLLSDPGDLVRAQSTVALATFGPKAAPAIPRLMELLDDSTELARACAAQSLGAVDAAEKRSAGRLQAMLDDPDAGCRTAAAETLKALGLQTDEESAGEKDVPAK